MRGGGEGINFQIIAREKFQNFQISTNLFLQASCKQETISKCATKIQKTLVALEKGIMLSKTSQNFCVPTNDNAASYYSKSDTNSELKCDSHQQVHDM